MTKKSVQALLEGIRLMSEQNYEIVEAVRALVRKTFETSSEEVKYGGILFTSGVEFCGVFAYKAHVSVLDSFSEKRLDKPSPIMYLLCINNGKKGLC